MNGTVQQIFPPSPTEHPLKGLYLGHDLRLLRDRQASPYVWANFVTSLDGRVAIPHPTRPGLKVPEAIANERDWRLFQELAAQADLLISTGRYLRDVADGRAQELLRVDDPRFADLREWRRERGLPVHPDILVVSASLDFPIPEALTAGGRQVLVACPGKHDPKRAMEIGVLAGEVIVAGEEELDGRHLMERLWEMGYRLIYSTAGPRILHMLLKAQAVDRLYLTFAHRMLGGDPYASVVDGALFVPSIDLKLRTLYYDSVALEGCGQLLASYDVVNRDGRSEKDPG